MTDPQPDPAGIIPALVAAGVLAPADCLDAGIVLIPVGRSHVIYRVERFGIPIASAKLFGPRRGHTDGDPACETSVARLAAQIPALAALVPAEIASPDPRLVLRHWVAGRTAWEGDSLARGDGSATDDIAALGQRLMPALAAMHRATAAFLKAQGVPAALDGTVPWALRIFDGDAPLDLWQHGAVAPLMASAAGQPALVNGLRRARGAWRAVALIHGDCKHDNVILRADAGPHDPPAALIDWEMARHGDPAWDLAGLMFRPLMDPAPDRGGWSAANIAAAAAMLQQYGSTLGLQLAPVAQRLVLYCGAWILMNLVQFRSSNPKGAEADQIRMLSLAADSFQHCDRLVAAILDLTGA